jgi:hypothetical protein
MSRRLLDAKAICREYGIPVQTAYRIMREVGTMQPKGVRKIYVWQDEFEAHLEATKVKT